MKARLGFAALALLAVAGGLARGPALDRVLGALARQRTLVHALGEAVVVTDDVDALRTLVGALDRAVVGALDRGIEAALG